MSILKHGTIIIRKHKIPIMVEGYETEKGKFVETNMWIDFNELERIGLIRK